MTTASTASWLSTNSWFGSTAKSRRRVWQLGAEVVLDRIDGERTEDVAAVGQGDHRKRIPAPAGVVRDREAAGAVLDDGHDGLLVTHGLFLFRVEFVFGRFEAIGEFLILWGVLHEQT